ncbi:uncharacterized protein PHALS_08081 [Plasmopara halstedii]|uniref:Uncharacterized protein n=1 Tax=Plasmopara halstedii TaxID=4781 RepID=A0A0P1B755_PLAHL|nr:uncharacterized protein PHALS_08081 [Plasmopara halstedii]CEG50368.1 hypothetical protein PHALS_08081 [Plasmopara halstedii]|eukprot:XP_024586737.1 hypothetical protein PHALS_08081 [Plasmopara halstedii]
MPKPIREKEAILCSVSSLHQPQTAGAHDNVQFTSGKLAVAGDPNSFSTE